MISLHSNTSAQSAMYQHRITSDELARTYEKLSTGNRINSARDDASGLATSVTLSSKVSGDDVALRNLLDFKSMLETRMSYYDTFMEFEQRARELVIQAGGPGIQPGSKELTSIVNEIKELGKSVRGLMKSSLESWSGTNINMGYATNSTKFIDIQYGSESSDKLTYGLRSAWDDALRTEFAATWIATDNSKNNIRLALRELDVFGMDRMINERADDAAMINRVDSIISGIHTNKLNIQSSLSRIRDADIPAETAKLAALKAKEEVSMMAIKQSKVSSEIALQLLR